MTNFFSHAGKNEQGEKFGNKLLKDHTLGVTSNALAQYYLESRYSLICGEELRQVLSSIGLYHDLGKYTSFFQKYLLGKPHDKRLKQHARFGAQAILQRYDELNKIAFISYFIVKNHHRSLHNPDQCEDDKLLCRESFSEVEEIFLQQVADIKPIVGQIEAELGIENLVQQLKLPDAASLRKFVRRWVEKESDPEPYFLINYLFSLLIEGDKLDASGTDVYQRSVIPSLSVDSYFLKSSPNPHNTQNRLRNEVRSEVIATLEDDTITQKNLFLLTAPTGIGKTLTALDFALRFRNMLPDCPQIIVGLPFINIIEQTLDVYQRVLGNTPAKIMAHYQYADIFGTQENDNTDEEVDYSKKRMEIDTWQADIIITSFVQLLQTLISHRNKTLLKFNHFAGAIVIMDEVQSLRLEQAPLIGAVIYYMSRFLNTRFILMTATKPLIFELADKVLLDGHSLTHEVTHLLPNPERYFLQFHRTQIIPAIGDDKKLDSADDFISIFKDKWTTTKSCLIVCNTVNRSIEVFEAIKALKIKNPLYYLSTNVLPIERANIINDIKKQIKSGSKPILVATQVVEAGVDLDFDMGFRDLGPVDSIVQVAGRINRENDPARAYAPLYIIDFDDCRRIYGKITEQQAIKALGDKPIPEPQYFRLVETYFWELSDKNAYDYSKKLFKGICHLQYNQACVEDTLAISRFRVIDESPNVISVFVEWDEQATKARQAYINMLNAPTREQGFALKETYEREHKKTLHQRIIAVPKQYTDDLPPLDAARPDMPIKWIPVNLIADWYQSPTGFNRKKAAIEKQLINKATSL